MIFADSFFDRHMLSTDTNEYATGLNDENDFLENSDYARLVYNETDYNRLRIN